MNKKTLARILGASAALGAGVYVMNKRLQYLYAFNVLSDPISILDDYKAILTDDKTCSSTVCMKLNCAYHAGYKGTKSRVKKLKASMDCDRLIAHRLVKADPALAHGHSASTEHGQKNSELSEAIYDANSFMEYKLPNYSNNTKYSGCGADSPNTTSSECAGADKKEFDTRTLKGRLERDIDYVHNKRMKLRKNINDQVNMFHSIDINSIDIPKSEDSFDLFDNASGDAPGEAPGGSLDFDGFDGLEGGFEGDKLDFGTLANDFEPVPKFDSSDIHGIGRLHDAYDPADGGAPAGDTTIWFDPSGSYDAPKEDSTLEDDFNNLESFFETSGNLTAEDEFDWGDDNDSDDSVDSISPDVEVYEEYPDPGDGFLDDSDFVDEVVENIEDVEGIEFFDDDTDDTDMDADMVDDIFSDDLVEVTTDANDDLLELSEEDYNESLLDDVLDGEPDDASSDAEYASTFGEVPSDPKERLEKYRNDIETLSNSVERLTNNFKPRTNTDVSDGSEYFGVYSANIKSSDNKFSATTHGDYDFLYGDMNDIPVYGEDSSDSSDASDSSDSADSASGSSTESTVEITHHTTSDDGIDGSVEIEHHTISVEDIEYVRYDNDSDNTPDADAGDEATDAEDADTVLDEDKRTQFFSGAAEQVANASNKSDTADYSDEDDEDEEDDFDVTTDNDIGQPKNNKKGFKGLFGKRK